MNTLAAELAHYSLGLFQVSCVVLLGVLLMGWFKVRRNRKIWRVK